MNIIQSSKQISKCVYIKCTSTNQRFLQRFGKCLTGKTERQKCYCGFLIKPSKCSHWLLCTDDFSCFLTNASAETDPDFTFQTFKITINVFLLHFSFVINVTSLIRSQQKLFNSTRVKLFPLAGGFPAPNECGLTPPEVKVSFWGFFRVFFFSFTSCCLHQTWTLMCCLPSFLFSQSHDYIDTF